MKTFKSKTDTWLLAVLLGSCGVILFTAIGLAAKIGPSSYVMVAGLVVAGIGLPLWLLCSTKYTVSNETLLIRSGPFKWTVPIDSITRVTETRNPLSSPALSLDRLELQYGTRRAVMVSPEDKQGFLAAIGHAAQAE